MNHSSKLGAIPVASPGWTAGQKQDTTLIDCDVHHNFRHPEQLLPYLSTFYQEHFLDQGLHLGRFPNIPIRTNRVDLKGRLKTDSPANKDDGRNPHRIHLKPPYVGV